jgi:hypothetical protein
MSQEGVMRIRRRIQQDGFAEALAKAHNDGWVEGFRLGKEEGIEEERRIMCQPPTRQAVHRGNHYLGKHIDTIGNTFSIYVDESPIVLPYRRDHLIERTFGSGRTEILLGIQTRLSIHRELIGRDMEDRAYRDNSFTAYYIPYRDEGYLA